MELRRAIGSALLAAPNGDVEVIVVANGPDESWKVAIGAFAGDRRVRALWDARCSASAARNVGLIQSNGKYVRFLDDDDVLYPAAALQLQRAEQFGADVASGPLENRWGHSGRRHTPPLPAGRDLAAVALRAIAMPLTQGSVFRTAAVRDCRWPEDATLYDDYLWMLDVVRQRELVWQRSEVAVGGYIHHFNERLSHTRRSVTNSRQVVCAILATHQRLTDDGRHSPERTQAAASALLTHAHSAFPAAPVFLAKTIRIAQEMDSNAEPQQQLFRQQPWLARHLEAIEWAALLPRCVSRAWRRLGWRAHRLLAR